MKLKMNNLPTIPEDLSEAMDETIDSDDVEELGNLQIEIENLEVEKAADQESDPMINQMKLDAMQIIEKEMQQRRSEYIMQKKRDAMVKVMCEQFEGMNLKSVRKNQKVKSVFKYPQISGDDMTEKEKADALVPQGVLQPHCHAGDQNSIRNVWYSFAPFNMWKTAAVHLDDARD